MSDDGWTWELSSTAEDDLAGLSPADQDRILDRLDEVVSLPWRDPPDYGEPLQNGPYEKIRSGSSGRPRPSAGRLLSRRRTYQASRRRVYRCRRLFVGVLHPRLTGTVPVPSRRQ